MNAMGLGSQPESYDFRVTRSPPNSHESGYKDPSRRSAAGQRLSRHDLMEHPAVRHDFIGSAERVQDLRR